MRFYRRKTTTDHTLYWSQAPFSGLKTVFKNKQVMQLCG
jgi:hypothetical protein